MWAGQLMFAGKLGDNIHFSDGQVAARYCALNLIAQVKESCHGDLNRVTKFIKLSGFVISTIDFAEQAKVISGASALMCQIFENIGLNLTSIDKG